MIDNKTLSDRMLAAVNGELGWNGTAEDGEVRFESDMGLHVWLPIYPSDPEYVHMFTGFGISRFSEQVGSPLDVSARDVQARLIAGANRLTRRMKGTKVTIRLDEPTVVFSVEMILAGKSRMPTVELLAAVLPRMRSMLTSAVGEFREEVILIGHATAELSDLAAWEE